MPPLPKHSFDLSPKHAYSVLDKYLITFRCFLYIYGAPYTRRYSGVLLLCWGEHLRPDLPTQVGPLFGRGYAERVRCLGPARSPVPTSLSGLGGHRTHHFHLEMNAGPDVVTALLSRYHKLCTHLARAAARRPRLSDYGRTATRRAGVTTSSGR